MNISDSNINISYNNQKLNIQNQSEAASKNNLNISENQTILALKEGQSLSGTIMDITNNKVSIMLDSNKTLLATLADSVSLNIGDFVSFSVKENNGANVVITPNQINVDVAKNSTIIKILDSNGFFPSEKNYVIANALMEKNMPVDKTSMQKVMQQSLAFPDTGIETLVSMNKMGIPVNEKTIAEYKDYVNNTHQISNNINDMTNSLMDVLENISKTNDFTSYESLSNKILDIFTDKQELPNININNLINEEVDINKRISSFFYKSGVSEDIVKGLVNELKNNNVSDKVINEILDKSENGTQLLNNINDTLKQIQNGNTALNDINLTKNIITGNSYKELLHDVIKEKMSFVKDDLDSPEKVDEYYNKIYEKANKILESFSENTDSHSENLSHHANGVKQRVDFIRQLNNMFSYAQLPVKLDNSQMNSELFVYMNKKNMKNSKQATSAMLHLDMDHLGPTDVRVELNGSIVSTKFYVEDEESARIIDEHMNMLEKALNDAGYNLNNQTINRKNNASIPKNQVVSELTGAELEKSVKRFSFDMRM